MKKISVDIFNQKYESEAEMSRVYKIKPNVFYRRINLGWSQEEALGISRRGLDAKIKNGEKINRHIEFIEFAYIGRNGKTYYECLDISILEEMLLNSDEILMYRQPDLKTAIQEMLELNSHVVEK
jgi:hypothetical protein